MGPTTLATPRSACCTPIISPNSCLSAWWLTSAELAGNKSAVPSGSSVWYRRNVATEPASGIKAYPNAYSAAPSRIVRTSPKRALTGPTTNARINTPTPPKMRKK